ncbi:MAG: DNA integrity scanning protein DisA nucleotide-binding domain protein [Bacilli bacterium]|nr:DNA integrity scanning protein DisA nucleotide-binding domain protein [Bacilli bacterium]
MRILDIANSPAFHLEEAQNWAGLACGGLIAILLDIPLFFIFRRTMPRIYIIVAEVILIACWLFGLTLPLIAATIALMVGIVFFFIANQSESRTLVANNMVGKANNPFRRKKKSAEVLFDRDAVYEKIRDAVLTMSEQKIGAIITLEKKDSLSEFCHNGTMINAPVSSELLLTIFYKGTRLHDGAVIIRNDMILAAAVAYLPTTRPLTGKYGLRHRAAIGISEEVDAVTVVVSEETGRISIAYQSTLDTVSPKDFLVRLKEYMAMDSVLEGSVSEE